MAKLLGLGDNVIDCNYDVVVSHRKCDFWHLHHNIELLNKGGLFNVRFN